MTPLPSAHEEARPRPLSVELEDLRTTFTDRPATLAEVVQCLGSRAYTLLLIVFALPFAPPVSVPGSSTPLGLIIAVIAAQLALGRLPWLPKRLLRWQLPAGFFTKLVPLTQRIVQRLERVLHPRWLQWTTSPAARAVHYSVIVIAGLLLALPILIPFTNMCPGWVILLLACGLLERDGVCVLFGHILFLVTLVFFAVIGSAVTEALIHAWRWIAG